MPTRATSRHFRKVAVFIAGRSPCQDMCWRGLGAIVRWVSKPLPL